MEMDRSRDLAERSEEHGRHKRWGNIGAHPARAALPGNHLEGYAGQIPTFQIARKRVPVAFEILEHEEHALRETIDLRERRREPGA